jgi:hypothetical protein
LCNPLASINDPLRAQGFFKTFSPPGIEVVSWYVKTAIGQVVTQPVPFWDTGARVYAPAS